MLTEMSPAELVSYERELRLRGPAGPTLKCVPASDHNFVTIYGYQWSFSLYSTWRWC